MYPMLHIQYYMYAVNKNLTSPCLPCSSRRMELEGKVKNTVHPACAYGPRYADMALKTNFMLEEQ